MPGQIKCFLCCLTVGFVGIDSIEAQTTISEIGVDIRQGGQPGQWMITRIHPGGEAQKARVPENWFLLTVDGKSFTTEADLKNAFKTYRQFTIAFYGESGFVNHRIIRNTPKQPVGGNPKQPVGGQNPDDCCAKLTRLMQSQNQTLIAAIAVLEQRSEFLFAAIEERHETLIAVIAKLEERLALIAIDRGGDVGGVALIAVLEKQFAALTAVIAQLEERIALIAVEPGGEAGGVALIAVLEQRIETLTVAINLLEKRLALVAAGGSPHYHLEPGCCQGRTIYPIAPVDDQSSVGGSLGKPDWGYASQPRKPLFRPRERTWLYSSLPHDVRPSWSLVVGKLQAIQGSLVELVNNRDKVVRIPLQEFSLADQRIIVEELCQGNRIWTDVSEQFHREAQFARVEGRTVLLSTENGEKISVPLEELCAADRCVVKHLWQHSIAETVPPPEQRLAQARFDRN